MLKGPSVKGIDRTSLLDFMSILEGQLWVKANSAGEVTIQSRVGSRCGFRSGVNTRRCPGLGVRALRLES